MVNVTMIIACIISLLIFNGIIDFLIIRFINLLTEDEKHLNNLSLKKEFLDKSNNIEALLCLYTILLFVTIVAFIVTLINII